MILGRHKRELEELRKLNEDLKKENDRLKASAPQIEQLLLFIGDINQIGAGFLQFRRVHPDSVFLHKP